MPPVRLCNFKGRGIRVTHIGRLNLNTAGRRRFRVYLYRLDQTRTVTSGCQSESPNLKKYQAGQGCRQPAAQAGSVGSGSDSTPADSESAPA